MVCHRVSKIPDQKYYFFRQATVTIECGVYLQGLAYLPLDGCFATFYKKSKLAKGQDLENGPNWYRLILVIEVFHHVVTVTEISC
jgi:hypothetical protein